MPDFEYIRKQEPLPFPDEQGSSEEPPEERYPEPFVPERSGGWQLLFLVFLVVIGAFGGLAFYAGKWKKDVDVRKYVFDGNSIVSTRELADVLKLYHGRNLDSLEADDLRQRVLKFPYIKDVIIIKEMNGLVRIRVVERIPLAQTVVAGKQMIVDREGFLLPLNSVVETRFQRLPQVSGISRPKAQPNGLLQMSGQEADLLLRIAGALSESEYAKMLIREVHLESNNKSYCLTMQTPTRFIVGNDGNFKEKLKKFEIFWQKVVSKKGFDVYETVDLRFKDRVFTRDSLSLKAPQDVSL